MVDSVNGIQNGLLKPLDRLEVVVVNRGSFQVAPETLDQIQMRRIRRVPDHCHSVAMLVEELAHRLGAMDRTIVQE